MLLEFTSSKQFKDTKLKNVIQIFEIVGVTSKSNL